MIINLIVIEAIVLGMQFVLYFGSEIPQNGFRDTKRRIDDKIPLIPVFAFIYVMWFPMVAIYPLVLYHASPEDYAIYQIAIITSNIVSTIIYLLWPTMIERREPPQSIAGRFLRFVYKCDFRGCNCSPSLHCIQCFIIQLSILACVEIPLPISIIFALVTMGIVISTLFTKQHVLIDVLTAVPTALASYAAGYFIIKNIPAITEIISAFVG